MMQFASGVTDSVVSGSTLQVGMRLQGSAVSSSHQPVLYSTAVYVGFFPLGLAFPLGLVLAQISALQRQDFTRSISLR